MKFSNLPSFCLLLLALTTNLRAEFVQPVAVQASNGENVQDALINGLGFDDSTLGSPESIHSPAQSEMWSGIGSIKADVTFDLGQTVDLTKIYIWNYNVQNNTDVGMKDVEVLVSSGTNITNSVFTGIAKIALREGLDSAQAFNVVGTSVRLVKLRGLSNWGQGYSVGLAEVRFASGDITGEVPTLVISSPHEGDVIPLGTSVTLDVKVTDKDNDILKIEIFDGTVKLGETNRAPVLWNVPAPSNGEHAYRIVATDKSGKVGWSTVNIVVRELAADGILQIDDTENIGEGTNTITYTGTWNLAQGNANDPRFKNNDHYSDVRNAYFEVRFKGVKVDVYGTVASHHGSGIATIDGGTEYTVSYKATQRKEQALVWSSPILPNKEHVLRIRVQGNGVITADRFDVHISNKPDQELPTTKKITATFTNLVVEIEDATGGALDATSVKLFIDETLATPASISVTKAAPLTRDHAHSGQPVPSRIQPQCPGRSKTHRRIEHHQHRHLHPAQPTVFTLGTWKPRRISWQLGISPDLEWRSGRCVGHCREHCLTSIADRFRRNDSRHQRAGDKFRGEHQSRGRWHHARRPATACGN